MYIYVYIYMYVNIYIYIYLWLMANEINTYIRKNLRLSFFTNTDSLMYEIKTEDVYEDFNKDKELFDFTNYSAESKYYDDSKKLVVGKMKYGKNLFFSHKNSIK